jgi:glutamyl-tRNA synthetase
VETVEYEPDAISRHLSKPEVMSHVDALLAALRDASPFDDAHVEETIRRTATELGLKAGALIHPTRVAMTGRTASPGIFETIILLGQDRALARLEALRTFLARPKPI